MKAASFVPTISAISADRADEVPVLEATISFWTEGRPAEEWLREVENCWGTAGFVLRRGDEVHGFVLFAPREALPRAGRYPVGPLDDDAVLLAFVDGDARTRRRLLVRMLRDLRLRGVAAVDAVASDRETAHHAHTRFLLESGWRPVRRASYRLGHYTLVRTELGSAVEVGELARSLVGKVRLPSLKGKVPSPGVLAQAEGEHRDG
ncbi:MAG: hypothetical protein AVDCRST_MAG02-2230 [uncultured Rubrobacteraceae bacterium]|uniref:N-acetyltransferase domain-containing protein n=1 Tax=uncultured Rubrobacteraceae bacterium TaxID=349277 RepID=A0A6J4R0L2_9ACTN|nr:MAG: hypothetical protein AVDCRST_MAG02-2230 [uncultured Rubrobacteraceae bacterium]